MGFFFFFGGLQFGGFFGYGCGPTMVSMVVVVIVMGGCVVVYCNIYIILLC